MEGCWKLVPLPTLIYIVFCRRGNLNKFNSNVFQNLCIWFPRTFYSFKSKARPLIRRCNCALWGKFNSQLSTISEELKNILNNLRAKILQDFKRGDIKVNAARCWDGHAKSRRKILWSHFKVLHCILSLKCDDLEFLNTYIGVSKRSGSTYIVWKSFLSKAARTGGFCLVCERVFEEIFCANFWRMSPRQLIL